MNPHQEIRELLALYRDLDEAERGRVEGHVEGCAECAARLAAYRAMDQELADLTDPQPDKRLSRTFYAVIARDGQSRRQTEAKRRQLRGPELRRRTFKVLMPVALVVVACVVALYMSRNYAQQTFSDITDGLAEGGAVQSEVVDEVADNENAVSGLRYSSQDDQDGYYAPDSSVVGHVQSVDQPWPLSSGGTDNVNDAPYDLTYYESYGVNPFIDTEDDHFSTFAMDVDTASYTVMRRYLRDGHLPDKDSVRVEEYVNYFRQDYAPPTDLETAFAIHLEGGPAPFGGENYHLLRIGIQGYRVPDEERKDASLVFVIDVSGSMDRENRLGLVKRALRLLVNELRPTDTVGLVVYGSQGRVILEPTPASDSETILSAIDRLQPEGSTNAEEGLLLGYEMANRYFKEGGINRVILCSDGVANVGNTGPDSILAQIQEYADAGVALSTVGFGMGNYNDVLMEQLADNGDGNYAYVDTLDEAERIFVGNLTGMLQPIALDAKIQVDFNPEVVSRYRLLGYENRDVADEDFRNDEVDAGEVGAGHSVTALYEVKFHPEAEGRALTAFVRYQDPDSLEVQEISQGFYRQDFKASLEETSPRFRLSAAVAEYAEILRESYWAKEGSLEAVLDLARQAASELTDDADVDEFIQLVAQASDLWAGK